MVAGLCVCEWGDDYSGCYVIGEKFYFKFDVTIFDVTVFDVPVFDVNSPLPLMLCKKNKICNLYDKDFSAKKKLNRIEIADTNLILT